MKKITMITAIAFLFTVSCGTVFLGTKEKISINSEPECKVYIDGADYKTPVVVKLSRGKEHTIKFEKDGYETKTITLTKHVGPGTLIANVLLTGLIGIVVDFVDGAAYGFDEKEVNIILEKEGVALNLPEPDDDTYYVILAEAGDLESEAVGELIE